LKRWLKILKKEELKLTRRVWLLELKTLNVLLILRKLRIKKLKIN